MTADRVGAAIACCLVAAALAGGFSLIGSPSHTREVALDQRRSEDLATIASALHNRYANTAYGRQRDVPERLPSDLQALRTDRSDARRDPVTGAAYRYAREDARHYRLCATFSSREDARTELYGAPPPHPAGNACFRFDLFDPWPFPQGVPETGRGS
ncbi:MAG: hypothetical protein QOD51_1119 [Candidatus Eremiobacteraeota bacterium]|nr:hypothetical protein [Candidatus Eremiobacteraeota bacterium]